MRYLRKSLEETKKTQTKVAGTKSYFTEKKLLVQDWLFLCG